MPELLYCGECAVKNISSDIPEIEIELLQEYRNRGIGYRAIILMLDILSETCDKIEFCARVEPDNYASQFLIEKLGGIPVGLAKCIEIPDERAEQFIEKHRHLLNERMYELATKFKVNADDLLTHLLVYKINYNALKAHMFLDTDTNSRDYIECPRILSKEKFKDVMLDWLEDLAKIKKMSNASEIINEMEAKVLEKMNRMKELDFDEKES